MLWNKYFFILFISIFIIGCSSKDRNAQLDQRIWATSDSIKIFKDSPVQKENVIWSGKDNLIKIKGAKNETVAFQLVINGGINGLPRVTVVPSLLKHKSVDGALSVDNFELFLEWYTYSKVRKGSDQARYYPDALVPFFDPYQSGKSAIASFFDVKSNENQPVWIDLYIPKDVASGKYTGSLKVLTDGKTLKTMSIVLEALPFTIPDERHLTAYSEMYGMEKEGLKGIPMDEAWPVLKEYWIMARKHRFDVNSTGYELDPSASSRWNKDGTYKITENTWSKYDRYLEQVIRGDIFTDKLPPNVWRLPFPEAKHSNLYGINCKYLSSKTWDKPNGCYGTDYEVRVNKIKSLAKIIEEHFLEKELTGRWPKGTLAKSFVYIIDEPKQYGYHYLYIKDYSTLIKEAAPQIKFMLTEQPEEPLFGYVDIWAAPASAYAPGRMQERQKLGEQAWFYQWNEPYIGSQLLPADAISLRMWAWAAWKYKVDGVFLWACNYWSSENPYTDPQCYEYGKATNAYGNGYVFYPGRMLHTIGFPNIDGPVSSIRMKMWRRGFLDYEYMRLAKQKGKEKETEIIVNSLVKSALAENYKEVTDALACANKRFDGQKTKFIDGKCIGACSDYTNKTCWYNEGILIGPWDCDDGPDESGKYPQWWEDSRAKKKISEWSKNHEDWIGARYKLAELIME